MITVDLFVCCERFSDGIRGLTIHNAFDWLDSFTAPVEASFIVLAEITFTQDEQGSHEFRLDFTDEDARPFVNLPPPTVENIKAIGGRTRARFLFSVEIPSISFQQAGEYILGLHIDHKLAATRFLTVRVNRLG